MPERSQRALAPYPGDAGPLPEGVHRIALPTPFPIGRVNTYLLEGSPLTLVDCGINTGTSLDVLEASFRALGRRLEDLELIVLTHEHIDHVGLAAVIAGRAGCPIAAFAPLQDLADPDEGPNDAAHARVLWSTAQLERHGYSRELALGAQTMLQVASAMGSRPPIEIGLLPGTTLRAGGRDWEILHRPGHSLSDLVLVDRASGVALVGDHILGTTSPNPTLASPLEVLRPDETTERVRTLPLLLRSMERTATDGLEVLLPGHGGLLGPPAGLIAERLAFHAKRADRLHEMLGEDPQTVYALATQMWRGLPMIQPHLTLSEVVGHLDVLADEGRATEVPVGDGVVGFVR